VKSGIMAGYTTEILPYGLRAKGFTWLNSCVTAALFFNQFVNGIALEAIEWRYYICYCIFLAFEIAVVYFYIVETRYVLPCSLLRRFPNKSEDIRPWKRSPSFSMVMMPLMWAKRLWLM
jgi:hypothetical protein